MPGAQAAARKLEAAPELAVDVEADAMHAFRARLCFLQVGTDEDVFLFDTLQPGVEPSLLAPVMGDPGGPSSSTPRRETCPTWPRRACG